MITSMRVGFTRSTRALVRGVRHESSFAAAVCTKIGAPLEHQTSLPSLPTPKGHVRIKVAAAGVNFADVLKVRGEYQEKGDPPFIPGNELSGEVSEVGEGVTHLSRGDKVVCLSRGGAYASETISDARTCLKLPENFKPDLAEAAGLLVNYGTAHLALTSRAKLREGQTVLVTAAAGGVGLAAVELATLMGASKIIPACGSEAKLALAASKGAAKDGINYSGLDAKAFRAKLKECAGPQGVDVVVDMVGGDLLEASVRSLNWNGTAVVVGFAAGPIPKIPANILLVKNVAVSGLFWGAHLMHDPKTLMQSAQQLLQWWAEGAISPHVCARYGLGEVNDAFSLIDGRGSTGKILIVP